MTISSTYSSPNGQKSSVSRRTLEVPSFSPQPSATMESVRETLNELVAGLSEQIAIVDEHWTIVAVNPAWAQMTRVIGYPELVPGTNYRQFLETFAAKGHSNAIAVLNGIEGIESGHTDSFDFSYAGVDQWQGRRLHLIIHRFRVSGHVLGTVARQDVTDKFDLGTVRENCTAAILNSETEARQRLTRELHDSTGQLVTTIGLLAATLKQRSKAPEVAALVDEIQELARETTRELRSISYLAQAPRVVEIGIVEALHALAAGFGRRAQLDVSFQVLGTRTRLSPAIKTIFYRIGQEALLNVYRHAHASRVKVLLVFRKLTTHLLVIDDGIGISEETLAGKGTAGVGVSGMRSRLAEFGGRLSLRCMHPGTAIIASIPVGDARRLSTPRRSEQDASFSIGHEVLGFDVVI